MTQSTFDGDRHDAHISKIVNKYNAQLSQKQKVADLVNMM